MIKILEESVANRIAAGEVVERPASVVKELIENALDAGARCLEIDLEDGGVKLIRVRDDGSGMSPEDAALCVLPHATSKITDVDDLFRVATFGFRGEALPSIAAISDVVLLTRTREAALGVRLEVEKGRRGVPVPAGAPAGTTVEVRNLFANVPARRKFLKHERTELAHCVEMVTRLMLPHPEVAVRVTHQGRRILEVGEDADLKRRIRSFFGDDAAARLIEAQGQSGSLALRAFVGPPSWVKTNSEHQYLFLNARFVRDRSLSVAFREAYRDLIMPRDFPAGFLFLSVDPAEIDVNVHPTKIEVRFREKDRVFSLIRERVRAALLASAEARSVAFSGSRPVEPPEAVAQKRNVVDQIAREFFGGGIPAEPVVAGPRTTCHGIAAGAESSDPAGTPHWLHLHRSYILAEDERGLVIVDQHALHERRIFDELNERVARSGPESQRLLVPEVVPLSATEHARLLSSLPTLAAIGLEIEDFGGTDVCVRALPLILDHVAPEALVAEVLVILSEDGDRLPEAALLRRVTADLACRAAVKFNQTLPAAEIAALLAWRRAHPEARNCPHGRPVALSLSLRELEDQFLRKR